MKPVALSIILGGSLALGCGSADNPDPQTPASASESSPVETSHEVAPEGSPDPDFESGMRTAAADSPDQPAEPEAGKQERQQPETGDEKRHEMSGEMASATAEVKMVGKDKDVGKVTFTQRGKWVTMSGTFENLPPGKHGIQLRTNGSCSKRAIRSGDHFNPTDSRHGPPSSAQRHVGDLGNIAVEEDGTGNFEMRTDSMTVKNGATSVVGRTVVITKNEDTGKGKSGNAGPVIACGTITE